ncbi:hypothetical protein P171DRAFT_215996 [Karstenula rhodostoma CBS 690.94]|uniref:Uncharacterized protein n=1 Tax=Karstenula rhodostoma CBS 690.94 TaxID=1392251 RepID=A0A9P4PNX5_9PLEO|nr:hypothetical protein P171DRAFT_215996 [Karstenula rhodostoma CBS 690.94]
MCERHLKLGTDLRVVPGFANYATVTYAAPSMKCLVFLCEICDHKLPVDEWREHNKSEGHYANKKEALHNHEANLSGNAMPAVNASVSDNDYYCDLHDNCGARPCSACELFRNAPTASYLPQLKRLVQMIEQHKTMRGDDDRAHTTLGSCVYCSVQGCAGCKPPSVLTKGVRDGIDPEPTSLPPSSVVNEWPISIASHVCCNTCERKVQAKDWQSHVNRKSHRKKQENRKEDENRRKETLKRMGEWKKKKHNDTHRSCGVWGCAGGCADCDTSSGLPQHGFIYDLLTPTAADVDVGQREALLGYIWGSSDEVENSQNNGNSWGGGGARFVPSPCVPPVLSRFANIPVRSSPRTAFLAKMRRNAERGAGPCLLLTRAIR